MNNVVYKLSILGVALIAVFVFGIIYQHKVTQVVDNGNGNSVQDLGSQPVENSGQNTGNNTLQNSNLHTAPVGGDKDAHGCILGAGYSWDATLNKCVRPWEKLSVLFDNKEWYLVDKTGAVRTDVSLRVNNGTISGKVCNVYSGSVAIHDADSTITVSRVVSTLMACTNNSLTQIETSLHKLLNGTIKVDLNADNGHITLTGNGEKLDFSQMYQQ